MKLEDRFGGKIVSFKTPNVWAPHFADLSPLEYFLWGYCKDNVYVNNPEAIDLLKSNVTHHMRSILYDVQGCSEQLQEANATMLGPKMEDILNILLPELDVDQLFYCYL